VADKTLGGDHRDSDDTIESDLKGARPKAGGGVSRALKLAAVVEAVVGRAPASRSMLGRYELLEVLGEGGMGQVLLARDPQLDRRVAIKMLHPDAESAARGLETMEREAKALAQLNHHNVLPIYDVGRDEQMLWVVMPYVAGGDLASFASERALDWRDLVELYMAAGEGLRVVHEAGMVHRDVKPQNILVDEHGVAKLADFGLARPWLDPADDSRERNYLVGTPRFIAPELMAGEDASPRSDQFSWAVALRSEADRLMLLLPPAIEQILERALEAEPDERWPDMGALLHALRLARPPAAHPRVRELLLDRVEAMWLQGMLDRSVGEGFVDLPVRSRPDLIEALADLGGGEGGPSQPEPSGVLAPDVTRDDDAAADEFLPFDIEASRARSPVRGQGRRLDEKGVLFDHYFALSRGSLLVLGQPGAGKTTSVLSWVRRVVERARRHPDAQAVVVFNVASFRGREASDLDDWCIEQLVTRYGLPRRQASSFVRDTQAVWVLDGLDELPSRHRGDAAAAIEAACLSGRSCVLMCRTEPYRALARPLRFGAALELPALDDRAASDFGASIDGEFLDAGFSRSPLWLTLRRNAESAVSAETGSDSGRWKLAFDGLVSRALSRGSADAELERRRLRDLATLMQRAGTSQLSLEDLQFAWLPGASSRRRSLATFLGGTWLFLLGLNYWATTLQAGRPPFAGIILGVASIAAIWVLSPGLEIKMVQQLKWSWRQALRKAPLIVGFSTLVGGLLGLAVSTPMPVRLTVGAQYGTLMAWVAGFVSAPSAAPLRPNQGFWTSAKMGLGLGLAAALVWGLFFRFAAVPMLLPLVGEGQETVVGEKLAIMMAWELSALSGLVVAALYGLKPALMHLAVRAGLARSTSLPFNLVPWLEDMSERNILRRVGGSYMFMHAKLRESLAGEGTA
jgi:hypothetical protein